MAQKYLLEEQIPNLDGGSDEPQIPNNEIWYTSSDGNVVKPKATDAFGANIVRNTYSNGKGVIKFDGDVTSIVGNAFEGFASLTSITIPNSVTYIVGNTFFGCKGLTSITIPNRVTRIGGYVFSCCTGLTAITIPDSVTSIGDWAFGKCTGLTAITIPDSVRTIGAGAFRDCTGLTSITIGNGVMLRGANVCDIGAGAFEGCSNLKTVIVDSAEDAEIIFKKISQNNITFDIATFVNVDENGVIVKDKIY